MALAPHPGTCPNNRSAPPPAASAQEQLTQNGWQSLNPASAPRITPSFSDRGKRSTLFPRRSSLRLGCLSPSPTDCALAPRRNGGIPRLLWSSHGADPRVLLRHYGADRTATTTCSSPAACLTTYESPDTPKPRASPPLESPPVARHGRVAAGPDAPRPCCRRRDVAKWVRAREKVPCAGYLLWGVSRLTADTRGCLKLKGSASVLSRCRELGAPAPLPLTVSKQGW